MPLPYVALVRQLKMLDREYNLQPQVLHCASAGPQTNEQNQLNAQLNSVRSFYFMFSRFLRRRRRFGTRNKNVLLFYWQHLCALPNTMSSHIHTHEKDLIVFSSRLNSMPFRCLSFPLRSKMIFGRPKCRESLFICRTTIYSFLF